MPAHHDARATERRARLRRLKRRLKAAVSVLLAAAAGAFLAAAKGRDRSAQQARDAGSAVQDAGAADGGVDREEHRKGLPVRDNLME